MSTGVPSAPVPDPVQPIGVPFTPPQTTGGAPDPAVWAQQAGGVPAAGYIAPTYPQGYAPQPVGPQRNMMIFVVSIILIVGGALTLIGALGIFALLGLAGTSTGLIAISGIFAIVTGAALIVVGIIGVQNAANLAKADLLFKLGILLCAIALVSMILGIAAGGNAFSGVLGFVLPVLFVIGAYQMKQQAAARG